MKRKQAEKLFRAERRRWKKAKGIAPARDRSYREWIATLPCLVCLPNYWKGWLVHGFFLEPIIRIPIGSSSILSECAHVGDTGRGMRQKCSDYETVPLCAQHHREGPEAHHKLGREFWNHHDLGDWKRWTEAFAALYLVI